jgi:hypothetical protein
MIQGLGEANAQREVEGKGEDERCIAEKRGHSAPGITIVQDKESVKKVYSSVDDRVSHSPRAQSVPFLHVVPRYNGPSHVLPACGGDPDDTGTRGSQCAEAAHWLPRVPVSSGSPPHAGKTWLGPLYLGTTCMMSRAMSYPRAVAILMIQGLGEANAQREVEGKGEDELARHA